MLGHAFYDLYEIELLRTEFEHIPLSPSWEKMIPDFENEDHSLNETESSSKGTSAPNRYRS